MKRLYIKKFLIIFLLFIFFIFLFSCVVLPRFHQKSKLDFHKNPVAFPQNLGASTERILCIDDNEQALLWRLRVIEEAKEELILTTFDFGDDESGRDIMAALLQAARRGVKVQIIVDGGNGLLNLSNSRCFHALDAEENVEARFYNPIRLYQPWRLNYRMHDKYLIADRTVYILGGRNTNNLFLGDFQEDKNIDRDILVYSPVPDSRSSLSQVRDYFHKIWNLPCTEPLSEKKGTLQEGLHILQEQYEKLLSTYPEVFTATDWEKETRPTGGITLLTNPIEPENKEPQLWATLMELMKTGKNLTIQTPYIICNKTMYQDLTDLCQGGRHVDLIINAIESGANPWGCTDYLNQKKNIRSTGIHIYEYLGPCSSHTKTVLIDDRFSVVGSFNFDMRSAYLDTEMMLLIDSPELNEHLRSMAADDMERSKHISPDGSVTQGSAYEEVTLSFGKKLFYGIIRAIILPFRPLL